MIGNLQEAVLAVEGRLVCVPRLSTPNSAQVDNQVADPPQLGLDDLEGGPNLRILDVHEEQLRFGQTGGKGVVDVVP